MSCNDCPDIKKLAFRDKILRAIRSWFYENGFMEVQTPVLVDEAAPEAFIDTFSISCQHTDFACLAPSPELRMKRLMACGASRIFQIGQVFRRNEYGRLHLPEFTMLEWYRADAGYFDLMQDCEDILTAAVKAADSMANNVSGNGSVSISFNTPFRRFRVQELFAEHAGWDPFLFPDSDRFNHDMAMLIEPSLPVQPLFIFDYPATEASLAAFKPDNPSVAERVEFYLMQTELANGFTELTDVDEQRQRFEKENIRREANGLPPYPMPERFLEALSCMPQCAGMAMGIDRLVMLLAGASSIDEVMAFPLSDKA